MIQNIKAPLLPTDQSNRTIQIGPACTALASTTNDSVTTSTPVAITLNTATSFFNATTISNGVFMAYTTTVSSTVYDEYIAAGVSQDYVVPNNVTAISFIADGATAKIRVVEK